LGENYKFLLDRNRSLFARWEAEAIGKTMFERRRVEYKGHILSIAQSDEKSIRIISRKPFAFPFPPHYTKSRETPP